MPQLMKKFCFLTFTVFSVALFATGVSYASNEVKSFDPAEAFCERQTFVLKNINEVLPWLDYFSGLRNGRSAAPDPKACGSSTIYAILNIVGSQNLEMAKDLRSAFLQFYVSRAMEPELADRRIDTDNTFRYRNDIVLAGFVWLLCPGHGDQRSECVKENVGAFPVSFLQTSPVFCDFAELAKAKVEWPPNRNNLPLVCASGGSSDTGSVKGWIRQASISLGD